MRKKKKPTYQKPDISETKRQTNIKQIRRMDIIVNCRDCHKQLSKPNIVFRVIGYQYCINCGLKKAEEHLRVRRTQVSYVKSIIKKAKYNKGEMVLQTLTNN